MAQVKELYMCRNMDDLEEKTKIPEISASKKMHQCIESARKVYKEAEKSYREGDEELAYVYYARYFSLLLTIHKKSDYSEHKKTVLDALGGKEKQMDIMDKLELIKTSLNKRYSRRQQQKLQQQQQQMDYSDPKSKEIARQNANILLTPSNNSNSEISTESLSLINCSELFRRIQEHNVLIMDCRPSLDYQKSHLSYAWAFNVPQEHILSGMSAGKLQDRLNSNGKVMWSARSVKDQVVLMDWNCKDSVPAENIPIAILLDILKRWDPDVNYRSPIKILNGGYEYFILMYPTLSTNPSVQAPQAVIENMDLIDDIEYPSIHDITMKDEIKNSLNNSTNNTNNISAIKFNERPSVDRSSKNAALKTYDQKQKPIVEIIKEAEEFLEKRQENGEQLEKTSKKLDSLLEKGYEEEELNEHRQLLYSYMQLENTANDYKIENSRLRDELDMYKREKPQDEPTIDVENLEEKTKHLETKLQECEKLDEEREYERERREKQLAIARENKRHMKPPAFEDEDEDMSKPKIPQFDRSIKPQIIQAAMRPTSPVFRIERRRDFSPVSTGALGRGLTGLKNLGNTCYMNSILQCLSNTQALTEYCLTDKYKKYISRNNKTKGHIVEELAALIKVLWNGNYKCVAGKDLRYVIGQYQQIFRGIEQQDSHEFLTILMDWLHSDLQTLKVPEKSRDNITASERAWLEFTKSKESLILNLFYGQLKSTVKCFVCNKESATYESFSNLSLELPPNVSHLNQCMDMYFSGELIHGWNCPNCKCNRDAVKKLDISKLPHVLVVHFKRFYADADSSGNCYRKKQDYVRFPLENLDMTPYIAKSESRSGTPKSYQLYGVSNHYGSMESGHYTAFCKSGNNGKWFKFDDQIVMVLDKSNVVSSAAYILFYTRLPPIQLPEPN